MMNFSTMTNTIHTECKMTELSGRDKVNLLHWLLEDLGITYLMAISKMSFEDAYKLQSNIHWNK